MDERPALWVGHVVLATDDLTRSLDFYRALGLRQLREPSMDDVLIELEMRGGTNLVLVLDPNATTDGRGAPFDLMADDLDALHATLTQRGIDPSPIARGGHDALTFRDPDGAFNCSTHHRAGGQCRVDHVEGEGCVGERLMGG